MPTSPDTAQRSLLFSGEFRPLLDDKKRITIPARWRSDSLQELFIIKSFKKGCLSAMPQDVLWAMADKAGTQSPNVASHQEFIDEFFANAAICPIDSQGRMVLSEEMCKFANLKKEVVLTGGGTKFDLWAPELREANRQASQPNYQSILKSIGL